MQGLAGTGAFIWEDNTAGRFFPVEQEKDVLDRRLFMMSYKEKTEGGCGRLGALILAKKLAVLARIYALGLLKEEEYAKVKKKIMQEHNVVTFEQI